MKVRQSCFLLLLLLVGCEKYYLTIKHEYVDRDQLASTYVKSPDPRQKNPPEGQELIVEWRLPPEAMCEPVQLNLTIFYRDYSQRTFSYPIEKRRGAITYSLLNKEFKEKEGFLTYKAEIVDHQGNVVKEWKQLLWTDLISMDDF